MADKKDYAQLALELHKKHQGKIGLAIKTPISSRDDLSTSYTPGVGAVSQEIANHPEKVWELTARRNLVAVVSDGSAVLGLGNIGPEASLPVMEGKAVLFKEFANVDAFPIVLDTQDPDEIISIVEKISPGFGGINLEDISAPRCFYIEDELKKRLSIPVMHDDQHGTAIVVLAGIINAFKLMNKTFETSSFVISGAGAAGVAIAKILNSQGASDIVLTDSKGIISISREDLNESKKELLTFTNPNNKEGSLEDALRTSDVFIGVSKANLLTGEMIKTMNDNPIIFALANPVPEIMPDEAKAAGAAVVATGRSDFPNQVNNVLAFPGVFRGAIDAHATTITEEMKIAASHALANYVKTPSTENILPDPLDKEVAYAVADAVSKSASV